MTSNPTLPLVSVIVPCFKMGRFISEALESVRKQTYGNWEIVAVDDCGPEDGTRAAVECFADQSPDQRVELITHKRNRGVSAARNTAIQSAKGDYFAFLDPDDLWLPDHLQTQMAAFHARPQLAVSTGPVKVFQREATQSDGMVWGYEPWELDRFPYSLVLRDAITMSAAVVSRQVMEMVGAFDEAPELQHIEDWDLWVRIAKVGGEFNFAETITCRYRQHPGGATADARKSDRRLFLLIGKHPDFWLSAQGVVTFHQGFRLRQTESEIKGILTIADNKRLINLPKRIGRRLFAMLQGLKS